MTPRQIRSVLKVMELGSVQRAAQALHLAPSSISAQIRELSGELGVTLFESAGRGIVPSAAARQLQQSFYAMQALSEEITQMATSIAHQPSGTLKLYAPSSMCIYRLPPLIDALQQTVPLIEIVLTHEPFDYARALMTVDIDAAITVTETLSDEWSTAFLYQEDVIYVCHPERYQPKSLGLEALNQHPIITTEPGCSYRVSAEAHFRRQGLQLRPRQAFANVEVIKRCLLANMGIGLVPKCVVEEELKQGTLKQQAVDDTPYIFYSALIYPKNRIVSPKLAAFLQVIKQCTRL
ncbi:LysR family transcriptional regulator [Thiolinea disciformis]|uniref:LysR family transcriptional regulator n=1 Tax=Thiolinea disciformis TaxID=125614 RepID=UPI00037BC50B|nr:LysR family transcriptional regulator [Thiolinea disciformis]